MAKRMREKAERVALNKDSRPLAIARYVRMSPTKVNRVLKLIRGVKYSEAVGILENTNTSASEVVLKVVKSAAANAENNLNMNKDNLFVAAATADQGPTLKRMMPRAKGRGDRILKRTSHIKVILDEIKA